MKFLSSVIVLLVSASSAYGVPQARSVNEAAVAEARGFDASGAGLPVDARSIENTPYKRNLGLVKRPNGPAPPSTGDPRGPPKRDLGLVKRPNGPAPPSKGDPHGPPK
ncbi:uncharacterized protein CTRU02_202567 [Colletotrichum truncatum]|uniref:Uncharacterized protein n=1 Tax=Colletotrichum truncatum TaxID=5467 RepID=A0ACC3ZKR0_COLTU|nr:uncharacterized protein CTRU02_01735 [Colletotrichum truncatum]KAF6800056.1 hypothetical protein CTRU02_01735 [Colletotrichum truncatum]